MTSRPPGEDASLAALPAELGTASAANGPAPADPSPPGPGPTGPGLTGPGQTGPEQAAPWFPSPYLGEGQAAPEAYPAPARPGQPTYGTPTSFQSGRQGALRQPGYGRPPASGPSGGPRQVGRPGPAGRGTPRDPSLASGWERLLAMTVDWMLILAVSYLVLYSQMERLVHQMQALVSSSQFLTESTQAAAWTKFAQRPSTISTELSYDLLVYGLAIACFWILQATTGATVGKLLLGLRVVGATDRTRAGIRAAGLRTLVFLAGPAIFSFGPLIAGQSGEFLALVGAGIWIADCVVLLSDPQRQSLHDRVAGTLVVRTRRGRSRPG
jgi:uncharacterized RDD family membrane protein YckC